LSLKDNLKKTKQLNFDLTKRVTKLASDVKRAENEKHELRKGNAILLQNAEDEKEELQKVNKSLENQITKLDNEFKSCAIDKEMQIKENLKLIDSMAELQNKLERFENADKESSESCLEDAKENGFDKLEDAQENEFDDNLCSKNIPPSLAFKKPQEFLEIDTKNNFQITVERELTTAPKPVPINWSKSKN
jgi:hypothetical protein